MRECTSVTPGFRVLREMTFLVVTGPAHAAVLPERTDEADEADPEHTGEELG